MNKLQIYIFIAFLESFSSFIEMGFVCIMTKKKKVVTPQQTVQNSRHLQL